MKEYTFDAMITVEAESEEKAADLILGHNMTGADIAVSLHKEGTLNQIRSDRRGEWDGSD